MRASGILMPIFSLPSPYGIGTFGDEAYAFVDFLSKAGQTYWQILPLNPTNFGDSPYQSFSSAAGNPYFIDLPTLQKQGLLQKQEYHAVDFGQDPTRVNYGKLYENRLPVLRLAFGRFRQATPADFTAFCAAQADWLSEYALFMALKDAHGGKSWREWEEPYRRRDAAALAAFQKDAAEDIFFYEFLQYEFYVQWYALKAYAGEHGIQIVGDMPIYVADDSVDVWSDVSQFDLDEDLLPRVVAGCPPDAFTEDGQLWGSPVYDWDHMKEEPEPYSWWRRRMRHALDVYDVVRIDHFRGFEAYYCIPYGEKTAKRGRWREGPGMDLFRALFRQFGRDIPIIAEDLGLMTPGVRKLLADTGFPGMKVLQFAFGGEPDNEHLLHNHPCRAVVYTGTHDNDTVMGWTKSADPDEVALARRYMHVDDTEGFNWAMIRLALMSPADTAILMMPDLMGLGSEARINTPSTLGCNWQWRTTPGCVNDWLARIVRENTALYGRLPQTKTEE